MYSSVRAIHLHSPTHGVVDVDSLVNMSSTHTPYLWYFIYEGRPLDVIFYSRRLHVSCLDELLCRRWKGASTRARLEFTRSGVQIMTGLFVYKSMFLFGLAEGHRWQSFQSLVVCI